MGMTTKQFRSFKARMAEAGLSPIKLRAMRAKPATTADNGAGGAPLIDGWLTVKESQGWVTIDKGRYVAVRSWGLWPHMGKVKETIYGAGTRVRVVVTGGPDRLTQWEILPPV